MVRGGWSWLSFALPCCAGLFVCGTLVFADCTGPGCQISFDPRSPTLETPVTVILEGSWPDACPRTFVGWGLQANLLRFDFQSPEPQSICAQVIVPWRQEVLVGQLPAGLYQVEVWYYEAGAGEQCLVATTILDVGGPTCPYPFEMDPDESWTTTGLWHLVDDTRCVSPGYTSPTHAFYFGQDQLCNYDTQRQASGELISPAVDLSQIAPGMQLHLSWNQWREVEYFPSGGYDCTQVWISFDQGGWILVWSADSSSPSESGWVTVATAVTTSANGNGMPLAVPWGASSLRVKFGFDTRDALSNDFRGWLIDDVRVCFQPVPELRITTLCPLPDAYVGAGYSSWVRAEGGSPPYIWSIAGAFPPGVAVTSSDTDGRVRGVPGTAGQHAFSLCVTDAGGNGVCVPCQINVIGGQCPPLLFYEDFSGSPEWSAAQLAHITDGVPCVDCALLDGSYAYFGRNSDFVSDAGCDYDTGKRAWGHLTSPWVPIPDCVTAVAVEFDSFRHVEDFNGAYDCSWVEVSMDGAPWQAIWYKDSRDASADCEHVLVGFEVPDGVSRVQIRFRFDSVDSMYNNEPGWAIDNVAVRDAAAILGFTLAGPLTTQEESPAREFGSVLTVQNVPNPIEGVNTTTFVVRGMEIEAVRIEVYDLAHSLVFEGEAQGTELVWHTEDNNGEYLANGVYLYRALALVGGDWVPTDFEKLVILR